MCGVKIRKLLSETQRIRVTGLVTATSGVDVRGWLQYGPVSCDRGLAATLASAGGWRVQAL